MSPVPLCDNCAYSAYESIMVASCDLDGKVTMKRWCLSCVRGDRDDE